MNEANHEEVPPVNVDGLRAGLDEALECLRHDERAAILLRFFEGKPFAEVGRALRVGEDAARMRVSRALEKLRTELERRGVTSTTTAVGALLASEAAIAAPAGLGAGVTAASLAGNGALSLAGILAFMSTTKVVLTTAAAAVVLTFGNAVWDGYRAHEAKVAFTATENEFAQLRAKMADAERRARRAQRESVPASDLSERKQTVVSPEQARWAAEEAGRVFLAAHPEVEKTLRDAHRARTTGQYLLLYKELGLSAAQVADFEKIHLDGRESVLGFAGADGLPIITLRLGEGIAAPEMSRRLRQLLGNEGYDKYMNGEWALAGSREAEVASAVYFTDTPLTPEQARRLAHAASVQYARAAGQPKQLPADYWAGLRKQAQGFLAEPQLEASNFLRAREEYQLAQSRAAAAGRSPSKTKE